MINLNQFLTSVKSILCLNGELPKTELLMRHSHLPLIAADGAGSSLITQGIIPKVIVGDLDSLDIKIIPTEVELIKISEQTSTDFDKAFSVIIKRELFPCLIFGATGKETDHTLYNLQAMSGYAQSFPIILHDSAFRTKDKYGLFVTDVFTAKLPINTNISFFAFMPTIISTNGLKWELSNYDLTPLIANTRNTNIQQDITITVHSGQMLIFCDMS